MANMFSGNQEKKVPRSLKECYSTDNVSYELWGWSQWLEKYGKILFCILIGLGIIMTISNALEISEIDEDLVFSTIIATLIEWGLYAFIEYCAYHILALLVGALATIVQNTRITANITLYKAATEEGYEETSFSENQNSVSSNLAWDCDKCGTLNSSGTLYCRNCGNRFSQEKEEKEESSMNEESSLDTALSVQRDAKGRIICPNCDRVQNGKRTRCWVCGQDFEIEE